MRISNNMLTNNYLYSLNKSLERQANIQEQLADGKAIHRPSDDPIKSIRALRFNTNLKQNEQYTQNVQDAMSWMETTDGAMGDLSSIMTRAKELVVKAATPNNDVAYQAIGNEIDGLINQIVQTANTKIGDRYIFAGQNDKTQPIVRTGDTFSYQGDKNKISMPIQPGAVSPTQDSVNFTGLELFGTSLNLLNNLTAIKNELLSGKPNIQYLSNTGLGNIEEDHDRLLQVEAQLGARMSMYEMAHNLMEENNVSITNDLANNEDINVPKTIIEFKNHENIYKMALEVGAKIMPVSLADFLN